MLGNRMVRFGRKVRIWLLEVFKFVFVGFFYTSLWAWQGRTRIGSSSTRPFFISVCRHLHQRASINSFSWFQIQWKCSLETSRSGDVFVSWYVLCNPYYKLVLFVLNPCTHTKPILYVMLYWNEWLKADSWDLMCFMGIKYILISCFDLILFILKSWWFCTKNINSSHRKIKTS